MSFQQGLSGLNAASKNLDVIGHNIANSNTVGFKASRAEFAEMVASAIGSAGGSGAGIGVETANVAQQFTQGNLNITGNNLDVAINGNGFFMLKLPDQTQAYTRAGNFKLDKVGNMVTNDGAQILGYTVNPVTGQRTSTEPVPMVFPNIAAHSRQADGKHRARHESGRARARCRRRPRRHTAHSGHTTRHLRHFAERVRHPGCGHGCERLL